LDSIIKYLLNPLKTGVYNSTFTVEFSGLEQLFRDISGFAKERKMESTEFVKIADELKERAMYTSEPYISRRLFQAFRELVRFEKCPKEIRDFLGFPEGESIRRKSGRD